MGPSILGLVICLAEFPDFFWKKKWTKMMEEDVLRNLVEHLTPETPIF